MQIELRELSLDDGQDILEMIREIGPGENGYANGEYDMPYEQFPEYLKKNIDMSKGIDIDLTRYVPQTRYWLIVDGRPVGIGKLRDYLNDFLKTTGGHIGYCIRPSERGKGYGNIILRELLKKAREKGIEEVLITCNDDNTRSRRVIEYNGGKLAMVDNGECRYWIKAR